MYFSNIVVCYFWNTLYNIDVLNSSTNLLNKLITLSSHAHTGWEKQNAREVWKK